MGLRGIPYLRGVIGSALLVASPDRELVKADLRGSK
jgi:hypothetical protein